MKLDSFLKKYVIGNNEELKRKMASPKYLLSNTIMGLEAKLKFSQEDTARFLGISLDKLLLMESVDLSIDIKEYQRAANKLSLESDCISIENDWRRVNEDM